MRAVTSLPTVAKMAARRVLRLAERQARAARPWPRPPQRIGEWRESFGLSPSFSGPGPLRDLPDWSFSDGRPSPPWRGQLRRLQENQELVRRALTLSRSLEATKCREIPVQTSTDRTETETPKRDLKISTQEFWPG
ncbi:large ribosomal subunit protein mL52-like isoform X2 [Chamaea fasciata]|uniref:large ribosomal subunit protein mL52-like isoform X2 n=1 Tax=Chamaea fasciata TaxID=190680 RepID=UPI003369BE9D